jgi:F-type H+-transporting ATPase subunit gamma
MPSLIDLRRRIRAVKNTQQITKAMKMVAASKLRRARERILSARPYAVQMQRVLINLAARVDPSMHALLTIRERRADSKTLVIVVTGDKGLCGSFNTNVIKGAGAFITGSAEPCLLGLVGRKGRDFFGRRGLPVRFERVGLFQKLQYQDASVIAAIAVDAFIKEEVDRVVLVYNTYVSALTQSVTDRDILPISPEVLEGGDAESPAHAMTGDFIFEPEPEEILARLLPVYLETQIYRALLESAASFQGAQMTAMRNASKNAGELIDRVTLQMNRARQAEITQEILEVVAGAEALS